MDESDKVCEPLPQPMPNVDTDTQLMNSWTGTVQNLGSLSTGLLYSVIAFISRAAGSLPGQ